MSQQPAQQQDVPGVQSKMTPGPDCGELVEEAGQRAVLVRGDLSQPQHCRDLIATAVEQLGGVDIRSAGRPSSAARR